MAKKLSELTEAELIQQLNKYKKLFDEKGEEQVKKVFKALVVEKKKRDEAKAKEAPPAEEEGDTGVTKIEEDEEGGKKPSRRSRRTTRSTRMTRTSGRTKSKRMKSGGSRRSKRSKSKSGDSEEEVDGFEDPTSITEFENLEHEKEGSGLLVKILISVILIIVLGVGGTLGYYMGVQKMTFGQFKSQVLGM